MRWLAGVLLCLSFVRVDTVGAQDTPPGIRLFLDCSHQCDDEYIREQIPVVDFVRDRAEADIHLLVTTEGTAGGGGGMTIIMNQPSPRVPRLQDLHLPFGREPGSQA